MMYPSAKPLFSQNPFTQMPPPTQCLLPTHLSHPTPTDTEIQAQISENEAALQALARDSDAAKAFGARMLLRELEAVKREFEEVKRLDRRSLQRQLRKERKRKMKRRTKERILAAVEAEELGKTMGMMAALKVWKTER